MVEVIFTEILWRRSSPQDQTVGWDLTDPRWARCADGRSCLLFHHPSVAPWTRRFQQWWDCHWFASGSCAACCSGYCHVSQSATHLNQKVHSLPFLEHTWLSTQERIFPDPTCDEEKRRRAHRVNVSCKETVHLQKKLNVRIVDRYQTEVCPVSVKAARS